MKHEELVHYEGQAVQSPTVWVRIDKVHPNKGQVPGLPANPRQWTNHELKQLAKSLKETPELFELRPLICYMREDSFVVLGGNFRLEDAKFNKMEYVPVVTVPSDTPVAKLREIVLKDNSSFGSWDLGLLREDWSDVDFGSWGINVTWDAAGSSPKHDVTEDDFDEDAEYIKGRVSLGDIWALGEHRHT